jgi:hypothetical protein
VEVGERYDDDGTDEPAGDPSWGSDLVDGAWLRTANPNSADGELQNIAAFGVGLTKLTGTRRTLARLVVWLILIGTVVALIEGIVGIVHTF